MKTNLEAWAFNFLSFGVVLPMVLGTFAHFHNVDKQVIAAKIEGCVYARKHAVREYVNCEEMFNEQN
jgi:hypothetical protein